MTQEQKKVGAIVGVLFVVFLLFLLKRPASIVQGGSSNMSVGGVTLPGFNYQAGQYGPIIMPGFASNPFDLSMINACCSDCSRNNGAVTYRPASVFNYVTNQGNKGPNIFVYQPPPAPKRSGMGSATFYQG